MTLRLGRIAKSGGVRAAFGMLSAVVSMASVFASATMADAAKPQRIVSLNLCTDQLLVDLVPAERIAGISFLGTDPTLSAEATRLLRFKKLRGTAEEVLSVNPDLVIAGQYTTGATVDLLRRLGKTVLIVPLASDFDGMRATVRTIAAAVGEKDRGEAAISAFDRRLEAVRYTLSSQPTAIAYQVGSFVSGADTLVDAALAAAGYHNLARDLKLGAGGRLPLEQLVTSPPDLVVLANAADDFRTVLADNLRHPALQELLRRRPSVHLPMPYWMCATPKIAEAVELLASKKAKAMAAAHGIVPSGAKSVP